MLDSWTTHPASTALHAKHTAAQVTTEPRLRVVEICAGAGGQSLGLEQAGFDHECSVELDGAACETLRANRPQWHIIQGDVRTFDGTPYRNADLLAGGVPCPPFSIAGKQLGPGDERDLFPAAMRLVREIAPRAVLIENVRGLASARFSGYRQEILGEMKQLGYAATWRVLNASDFGVPQLRPRFLLVAMAPADLAWFRWPQPLDGQATVASAIGTWSRRMPGQEQPCGKSVRGRLHRPSWAGRRSMADPISGRPALAGSGLISG
jgi:DNA (cytosine-5)-methyltransferase 1